LSPAEIAAYDAPFPDASYKAALRAFPNLVPDGVDADLTGAEAYARYGEEVRKLVEGLGGRVRYSGEVTGLLLGQVEELWDMVALAEYPSLAAFRAMAMSPEMHAIEHHRNAGLAGQLNIRTRPGAGF
jgi:uncharacterized protein (DUF1330 family)